MQINDWDEANAYSHIVADAFKAAAVRRGQTFNEALPSMIGGLAVALAGLVIVHRQDAANAESSGVDLTTAILAACGFTKREGDPT